MPMHPISAEGFGPLDLATEHGPAPQLQWINVADLVVDDSYQRSADNVTSRNNIKAIAARFDWRYFAPVVVSPVLGGRYAVVDGQHRSTAALLCGIEIVPCLVVIADQRQQAAAFRAINSQVTRITGGAIFKARLAASDEEAQRIRACIERAGVRLLYSNQQAIKMKPHETYALGVISAMVAAYGDAIVTAGLRAIRLSAGECQGYLTAGIIRPVLTILGENPAWARHPGLDAAMADLDLVQEREKAGIRAQRHPGQSTAVNFKLRVAEHLERALSSTVGRAA